VEALLFEEFGAMSAGVEELLMRLRLRSEGPATRRLGVNGLACGLQRTKGVNRALSILLSTKTTRTLLQTLVFPVFISCE